MRQPSYASVYRLACREALRAELSRSQQWRRDMAAKERAAIAAGEMQARDAIWQEVE